MLHVSAFQIVQILLITAAFCLHLYTFYDLSFLWGVEMVTFETTVYGTYFVIKIGYLIAVLTDGTFTPPLEAMTKLHGAVLFNILGIITVTAYIESYKTRTSIDLLFICSILKGIAAICISISYYIEVFQA